MNAPAVVRLKLMSTAPCVVTLNGESGGADSLVISCCHSSKGTENIDLRKAKSYSFFKNEETSLDKLQVYLRQQGFHFGLCFVGISFAIANEREGLEMREGLQLRQACVGQVHA